MDGITIAFLVGLFFVIQDSPILVSGPWTFKGLFRFILALILVILAIVGFSFLELR